MLIINEKSKAESAKSGKSAKSTVNKDLLTIAAVKIVLIDTNINAATCFGIHNSKQMFHTKLLG